MIVLVVEATVMCVSVVCVCPMAFERAERVYVFVLRRLR